MAEVLVSPHNSEIIAVNENVQTQLEDTSLCDSQSNSELVITTRGENPTFRNPATTSFNLNSQRTLAAPNSPAQILDNLRHANEMAIMANIQANQKQMMQNFNNSQRPPQPPSGGNNSGAGGGSGMSERAARREAMRQANIPTSQQPLSQGYHRVPDYTRNEHVRSYVYEVPRSGTALSGGSNTQLMGVYQSTSDRVANHPPHYEAGRIKMDGNQMRTDPLGRPKLYGDKVKVEYG